MKKLIRNILAASFALTVLSCTNILQQNNNNPENKSADGETYIVLKTSVKKTTSLARDINPDKDEVKTENLANLVLSGKEADSATSTMKTLAEAEKLSELQSQKIKITPGLWSFKLSAELNGISFSGETEKEIKEGVENTVRFVLTSEAKYGGLEITIEWTNKANKVVATLLNKAKTEEIATETYDNIAKDTTSVTFTRDIKKAEEQIASGTYYLKFDFYNETTTGIFDTYESYVSIADGLVTRKKREITLDKTFDIIYELNGENVSLAEGEIQPLKYSRKSTEQKLPEMKRPGYFWGGWYENEDFSGNPVTAIPAETGDQKTYYAKWNDPVLYVSGTGDDPTGDGTEANPFESIDKACEEIIATGDSEMAWVIYIMGDVTGTYRQNLSLANEIANPRKAGERRYVRDFGRSIIPSELTLEQAKSILITGYHETTAGNIPTDIINRGIREVSSTSNGTGPALAIDTEVPVTITNVKLANANNSNTNPNSDNASYYNLGGGLGIGTNSTVTLGDGAYIFNNKAGTYGGGVFNAGTLYINGNAIITANTCDDGGGIYNSGKLYLGYEDETTPKEWTGSIDHNNSWRGAGIKNVDTGILVMNSGCIKYNSNASNSNTGGGGVYNMGNFTMTGGVIEFNNCCHGGGVYVAYDSAAKYGTFTFSDGIIRNNFASYAYGAPGDGGGIYNNGLTYIYGNAVIGDDSASGTPTDNTISTSINITETAISTSCSNLALGSGGGIYVAANGKLYLGYSRYVDATENTPATWNKGIFYNHAHDNGGGLYFEYGNNVAINMNSGTISNNGAAKAGGAIYVRGEETLTLGGTTTIPAGEGEIKQSIAYNSAYPIKIADKLENVTKGSIYLIPAYETNSSSVKVGYSSYKPLITLTDEASTADITIDDIKEKFIIEPFTDPLTGIVTNWTIGSDGKVQQCIENLTVSATGTYQSIEAAIEKINELNDPSKDYVITLQGEISGPQVIEDPEGSKIKANTIKIIGTSNSSTISSIINANLTESSTKASALTINTTVPVYLRQIIIKGGHGNLIGEGENERIAGGGLFIGEGATVSFENFSKITENTNYIEGSSISGAGAGVYISKDAKFVMNYKTEVCKNTGTHYGAGIYVADGGYMKTIAGSGSDIYGNGFETKFNNTGVNNVIVKGGGIYLENGATLEQLGTYIRNNPISEGELGSGIYMCSTANYMISGSAQTNPPNDVYMEKDAQIEVIGSIGAEGSPNARLTLAYYPSDDEEIYPIKLKEGERLSWSNSSIANCFEITPQILTDNEKQYWHLEKNTGKLAKKTGYALSINIPNGLSDDIKVSISDSDGNPIENTFNFTGNSDLIFTAPSNFVSYIWKVNGSSKSTTNTLELDNKTANWAIGTYVVYLEVKDSEGKYYSYTAEINVTN